MRKLFSTSRPQTDRTTESMTGRGVVAITRGRPDRASAGTVESRGARDYQHFSASGRRGRSVSR
jgi:hypothetical protein